MCVCVFFSLLFPIICTIPTFFSYYRDNSNSIQKSINSKAIATIATHEKKPKRSSSSSTGDSTKVDRRIRRPIIEHHFTLPTSYKQKKRSIDHRKNATLERTSTKRNTVEQLINDAVTTANTTATTPTTTITTIKVKHLIKEDSNPNRMDCHTSAEMPKYLFGERNRQHYHRALKSNDKVYLNKSGWVQVNQRDRHANNVHQRDRQADSAHQKSNVAQPSGTSKLEAMITRNEFRRVKCTIDSHLTAMLNERPGFLPIKQYNGNESPPITTPIISPPPAFQDNETVCQMQGDGKKSAPSKAEDCQDGSGTKGMVFSRSFEYDNRKLCEYDQTFSKSFDYDFLSPAIERTANSAERRSPLPCRSASGYQQYLETGDYVERGARKARTRSSCTPRNDCAEPNSRARRGQFIKQDSSSSSGSQAGYRGHQQTQQALHQSQQQQKLICRRLNSCDSGARSGNLFIDL